MFYVKDGNRKIEIDYDNVYNLCPKCGCEVVVDLGEFFGNEDLDLYSSQVYCEECSVDYAVSSTEERLSDVEVALEKMKDTLRIIEKQNIMILTKHPL